jgi:hypothetical protein
MLEVTTLCNHCKSYNYTHVMNLEALETFVEADVVCKFCGGSND